MWWLSGSDIEAEQGSAAPPRCFPRAWTSGSYEKAHSLPSNWPAGQCRQLLCVYYCKCAEEVSQVNFYFVQSLIRLEPKKNKS